MADGQLERIVYSGNLGGADGILTHNDTENRFPGSMDSKEVFRHSTLKPIVSSVLVVVCHCAKQRAEFKVQLS